MAPGNLVLFTGDLTQKGSPEEFQAFENDLARLWEHLRKLGSEPRLLAIPGNHDLVRPAPRKAAVKALALWWEDKEISDEFWKDGAGEYRSPVTEAFKPLCSAAESNSGFPTASLHSERGFVVGTSSATPAWAVRTTG